MRTTLSGLALHHRAALRPCRVAPVPRRATSVPAAPMPRCAVPRPCPLCRAASVPRPRRAVPRPRGAAGISRRLVLHGGDWNAGTAIAAGWARFGRPVRPCDGKAAESDRWPE
ncbi:hypothetical protein GCM10022255_072760 [Dactylosporangium darangshiense]|uniref:Uncharacterized protein n=1 Tax=Dactylosporangium darangshiense TaxID=579108 RepID=A0ABP8DIW4_9ACTN